MNKYQNELFQFFISNDNFSVACDLVEHFGPLKKELMQQFWTIVAEKLKNKIDEQAGWKIYADKDFNAANARICAYKDQFCRVKDVADISISISNLTSNSHCGIWADLKHKDEKFIALRNNLYENRLNYRSDGKDSWWPVWQLTGIDFNNMDDVRKLDPSLRDEMVNTVVNSFMNFFEPMKLNLQQLLSSE